MSKTIVDMPKVTQMLDSGWGVRIYKGPMGSYEVRASHPQAHKRDELIKKLCARYPEHIVYEGMSLAESVEFSSFDEDEVMTDDFTPEQALTRMAYKVHGEIL